jgi:hypothetical protein
MAIPCTTKPGFSFTVYPCAIDNTTIPFAIDDVTPVNADIFNRARESILATQYELGLNPSGTYSTVRARLDAMEDLIASIIGGGGASIIVRENGSTIVPAAQILDFYGATVVNSGGNIAQITVAPSLTTEDEGSAIVTGTQFLNFIGPSVTVTNGGSGRANVTIGASTLFVEFDGSVTTSNSSTTTLATYNATTDGTYNVYFQIAAKNVINNNGNVYNLAAGFKRISGVITQIGSTSILNLEEDDVTLNADFSISGSNILVVVNGNASQNVNWKGVGQIVIAN